MYRREFTFYTLSLLIIMALIFSPACGSNLEKNVIGIWKAVKMESPSGQQLDLANSGLTDAEIEFFIDKTYKSTFDRPGQWTILDDGRIKMQNPVAIMMATIKGRQMEINLPISWSNRVLFLEKKF